MALPWIEVGIRLEKVVHYVLCERFFFISKLFKSIYTSGKKKETNV